MGAKHGFFTNLTATELHWLATPLRQAIGAPEHPSGTFGSDSS
jgi:hypothetical protein